VTFLCCAETLEQHPDLAALIRAAVVSGEADVCCQGLCFGESAAADAKGVAAALASVERTTGAPPAGWRWREAPSPGARRALADHKVGYDSFDHADDLPQWHSTRKKQLREAPAAELGVESTTIKADKKARAALDKVPRRPRRPLRRASAYRCTPGL
jgi:hypothetical protein